MATPGVNPVAALMLFGEHPFTPDVEVLVRELLALNHAFFDSDSHPSLEQREWEALLSRLAKGEDLEAGREKLRAEISRQYQRPR